MRRAEDEGRALVQGRRGRIKKRPDAVGCRAAGLLDDECDGVRLIKLAQAALAVGAAGVGRIQKDAAPREDAR